MPENNTPEQTPTKFFFLEFFLLLQKFI